MAINSISRFDYVEKLNGVARVACDNYNKNPLIFVLWIVLIEESILRRQYESPENDYMGGYTFWRFSSTNG